jgi:membrane fusion protein (multidrug efflux system)
MWTALVVFLLACGGGTDEEEGAEDPTPATVVNVETVGRGAVVERLATTAVVEAERMANLTPVTPGVVLSLHADDGDPVERGDLLATLESVSLQAGASRSRAEVARLQKQVTDMERLFAQGAVSERDLDDLRFQLQTARTNASEASRNFGQTRITAPFDGVVARRDARLGELANGTVFQVVDLSDLTVRVDLPERDAGRVEAGQRVRLTSAYDEEVRGIGRVERVSPVIDASTGTFRATVRVDPDQPLRPGQFVKVEIEVDAHEQVVVVPRKAVLWEDGRPYVYVMGEPDPPEPAADGEEPPEPVEGPVARRRAIQPGLTDDRGVEVLSGVAPGDQVVVVGQSNLKEGVRIRTPADNARAVPADEPVDPAEGG